MLSVPLRLVSPLVTSTGTHSQRTAVLIEVTLNDGAVGWGENVAPHGSFYTGESASDSVVALRRTLASELGAMRWDHPSQIDAAWITRSFPMARCALESAAWDAWSRHSDLSLADALGVKARQVPVTAVIGMTDSPATATEEARARVAEGYRSLKIKIAPGHDRAVVAAVVEAVGSSVSVGVDANGSYGSGDIDTLASLSDVGVGLIEQPFAFNDLASSAALVATGAVAVGLDETVMTLDDLYRALDRGALTALNVKPARVGGVTPARTMIDVARGAGLEVWVGGMLESGIGRAMAVTVAGLDGVTLPADLSASSRYFDHDLTDPFVLRDGALEIPHDRGLGRVPLFASEISEAGENPVIETVYERSV